MRATGATTYDTNLNNSTILKFRKTTSDLSPRQTETPTRVDSRRPCRLALPQLSSSAVLDSELQDKKRQADTCWPRSELHSFSVFAPVGKNRHAPGRLSKDVSNTVVLYVPEPKALASVLPRLYTSARQLRLPAAKYCFFSGTPA